VGQLTLFWRAAVDAFYSFNDDDGWAIASHIALSMLMSMFPFLIFVTALAGYAGSKELADEVARILFEAWPTEVAAPIAGAVRNVLTTTRGDVLTAGVAFAIYFSSSGIESVRIGLNRAYGMTDMRRWWWLRIESIGYVLVGAVALLILAFFVVLGPLIVATTVRYVPWLDPLKQLLTFARLGTATLVLVVALVVVHKWLPAGHRRMTEIAPGVVVTLLMWLAGGTGFGMYLAEFANSYVTMYAGLASAMIALVFLYWTASIFIYGGELNAAIARARGKRI
jgi:membrane protein